MPRSRRAFAAYSASKHLVRPCQDCSGAPDATQKRPLTRPVPWIQAIQLSNGLVAEDLDSSSRRLALCALGWLTCAIFAFKKPKMRRKHPKNIKISNVSTSSRLFRAPIQGARGVAKLSEELAARPVMQATLTGYSIMMSNGHPGHMFISLRGNRTQVQARNP